jgi:hypothetical protein
MLRSPAIRELAFATAAGASLSSNARALFWALAHGISEHRLERIFQYPHGRGSSEGIVRHEPNHDNHMHVRFQCPADDTGCH